MFQNDTSALWCRRCVQPGVDVWKCISVRSENCSEGSTQYPGSIKRVFGTKCIMGLHLPECCIHVFTSEPIESISIKFCIGRCIYRAGIARSAYRFDTGWKVRGSNPGRGGEIFRTRPDWPRGPPSLLYNGYRVPSPGVKRPGRGVNHLHTSSAEVKERVELYLYSPSGPSWPVLGWALPLHLPVYLFLICIGPICLLYTTLKIELLRHFFLIKKTF